MLKVVDEDVLTQKILLSWQLGSQSNLQVPDIDIRGSLQNVARTCLSKNVDLYTGPFQTPTLLTMRAIGQHLRKLANTIINQDLYEEAVKICPRLGFVHEKDTKIILLCSKESDLFEGEKNYLQMLGSFENLIIDEIEDVDPLVLKMGYAHTISKKFVVGVTGTDNKAALRLDRPLPCNFVEHRAYWLQALYDETTRTLRRLIHAAKQEEDALVSIHNAPPFASYFTCDKIKQNDHYQILAMRVNFRIGRFLHTSFEVSTLNDTIKDLQKVVIDKELPLLRNMMILDDSEINRQSVRMIMNELNSLLSLLNELSCYPFDDAKQRQIIDDYRFYIISPDGTLHLKIGDRSIPYLYEFCFSDFLLESSFTKLLYKNLVNQIYAGNQSRESTSFYAIMGQAGSGKLEMVKDFAKYAGRFCMVIDVIDEKDSLILSAERRLASWSNSGLVIAYDNCQRLTEAEFKSLDQFIKDTSKKVSPFSGSTGLVTFISPAPLSSTDPAIGVSFMTTAIPSFNVLIQGQLRLYGFVWIAKCCSLLIQLKAGLEDEQDFTFSKIENDRHEEMSPKMLIDTGLRFINVTIQVASRLLLREHRRKIKVWNNMTDDEHMEIEMLAIAKAVGLYPIFNAFLLQNSNRVQIPVLMSNPSDLTLAILSDHLPTIRSCIDRWTSQHSIKHPPNFVGLYRTWPKGYVHAVDILLCLRSSHPSETLSILNSPECSVLDSLVVQYLLPAILNQDAELRDKLIQTSFIAELIENRWGLVRPLWILEFAAFGLLASFYIAWVSEMITDRFYSQGLSSFSSNSTHYNVDSLIDSTSPTVKALQYIVLILLLPFVLIEGIQLVRSSQGLEPFSMLSAFRESIVEYCTYVAIVLSMVNPAWDLHIWVFFGMTLRILNYMRAIKKFGFLIFTLVHIIEVMIPFMMLCILLIGLIWVILLFSINSEFAVQLPNVSFKFLSVEAFIAAYQLAFFAQTNYMGGELGTETWGVLFYVTFSFLLVIVMLNVLIAIISDGYAEVRDRYQNESLIQLAQMTIQYERTFLFQSIRVIRGQDTKIILHPDWLKQASGTNNYN